MALTQKPLVLSSDGTAFNELQSGDCLRNSWYRLALFTNVTLTGTTSMTTLGTYTLKGNTLASNGRLLVEMTYNFPIAGTTQRTFYVRFGGVSGAIVWNEALGAQFRSAKGGTQIVALNATNSQLSTPSGNLFPQQASGSVLFATAVDTTADQDILIMVQPNANTDNVVLAAAEIWILNP